MNRMSIPSRDSLLRTFVWCAVLYCAVRTITNNIITVSIKYVLVTMLWLLLHGCNFFFSSSLPVIFPKSTQIERVGCHSGDDCRLLDAILTAIPAFVSRYIGWQFVACVKSVCRAGFLFDRKIYGYRMSQTSYLILTPFAECVHRTV